MKQTTEEFNAEKQYLIASEIARHLHDDGVLTDQEYAEIDRCLIEKFKPVFGALFSNGT